MGKTNTDTVNPGTTTVPTNPASTGSKPAGAKPNASASAAAAPVKPAQTDHENIEEAQKWNDKARNLLSIFGLVNESVMESRNNEVSGLLEKMATHPDRYGNFDELMGKYRNIADRAKNATESKTDSNEDKKAAVEECCLELHKLKLEARLEMGATDPTATEAVRAEVLRAARWKPIYTDKIQRINTAIVKLRRSPGARKQMEKLNALLVNGDKLVPDYEAAYKALKGLSGLLKAGRDAKKNFTKNLPTALRTELENARTQLDSYKADAGVVDTAKVAAKKRDIIQTLRNFDDPASDGSTGAVRAAVAVLKKIQKEIETEQNTIKKDKKDLETIAKDATEKIDAVYESEPTQVYAAVRPAYLGALNLLQNGNYQEAKEAFKEFDTLATNARNEQKNASDEWSKIDADLKAKLPAAQKEASESGNEVLKVLASNLVANVEKIRGTQVATQHYRKAVDEIDRRKVNEKYDELTLLLQNAKAGKAVQPPSEGIRLLAELAKMNNAVKDEREAALKSINELEGKGGYINGLIEELNETKLAPPKIDVGNSNLSRKKRQAALQVVTDGLPDVLAALKKIRLAAEKAGAGLNTADEIDSAKKERETEQETQKLRQEMNRQLRYLDQFGLNDGDPEVKDIKKRYAQVDKPLTGTEQVKAIGKILGEIQEKLKKDKTELDKKREGTAKRMDALHDTIKEMALESTASNALDKFVKDKTNQKSPYQPYFDSLADKITLCKGMIGSTVPSVLDEGVEQLETLEAELSAMAKTMKSKDANDKNFHAVETKVKAIDKLLDGDDLKNFQKVDRARLSAKLEKVTVPKLRSLSPEAALEALDDLEKEVNDAIAKAQTAKTAREELKKGAAEAKEKIEKLKEHYPNLHKAMLTRLSAVENAPEGEEAFAKLKLDAIQLQLRDADLVTDGTPHAMDMEVKANSAQLESEVAQKEFKAAKAVFRKSARRTAEKVKAEKHDKLLGLATSSECNLDIYEQMDAVYKEAAKLGKQGDYEGANYKLKDATSLARYFTAHPDNEPAAARKELKKLNETWKLRVSEYLAKLGLLRAKMQKDGGEIVNAQPPAKPTFAQTDVDKGAKLIERLQNLFGAKTFDAAVAVLSVAPDKNSKGALDLRKTKEAALLSVRRLKRILKENALLRIVVANTYSPFNVKGLEKSLNALHGAFAASQTTPSSWKK